MISKERDSSSCSSGLTAARRASSCLGRPSRQRPAVPFSEQLVLARLETATHERRRQEPAGDVDGEEDRHLPIDVGAEVGWLHRAGTYGSSFDNAPGALSKTIPLYQSVG